MAMEKVFEVPTAKMAAREAANWKKWTGGPVRKVKLANGWYSIHADPSLLKPAARLILGYPRKTRT